MKEALLYEALGGGEVRCLLCRHGCRIAPGKRGLCAVRENRDGRLLSLNYGRVIAAHLDPIEKKPLFHFLPGSRSFSIACAGCNFRCGHCQNFEIAQAPRDHGRIPGDPIRPEEVVEAALRAGAESISYTYTEPTVFFEFALETARLAARRGLRNVFVTNGYMSEAALRELRGLLDAANIDLKGFSEEHYRKVCGARLEPVKENIRLLHDMGAWVEVTTLIIPGRNDGASELEALAAFIRGIDPGIPWHVSRFHPAYRMGDIHPTPPETVREARRIGLRAGLRHVYTGNLPDPEGQDSFCPHCGLRLIRRQGYGVDASALSSGRCPDCGHPQAGVWK